MEQFHRTQSHGASSMVALMKVFHLLCLQSNDDHLKVEVKLHQRWSRLTKFNGEEEDFDS